MKISYERLNQIIEEEVTRFKKLNEAILSKPIKDMNRSDLLKALNDKVSKMSDDELKDLVGRA